MGSAVGKRRAATIHAYVGENGGGKSLAAITDSVESLRRGRAVAGTVLMLHPTELAESIAQADERWDALGIEVRPTNPLRLPHPLWRPVQYWSDLLELSRTDLLLDEVQSVVNSRASGSLPPAVLTTLLQLRRADVVCRWTTPSYARADVALREVTQAVTYCRGYLPERVRACPLTCEQDHDHIAERLWGANRVFLWRTYAAIDFDEFTSADVNKDDRREKLRCLTRQFYWRQRGEAQDYYDTLAPVLSIKDVNESGTCLSCGGTRRRPSCSCTKGPARTAAQRRTGAGLPDMECST